MKPLAIRPQSVHSNEILGCRSCCFGLDLRVIVRMSVVLLSLSPAAQAQPYFSTKWAMDDERYERRYCVPYSADPLTKRFEMVQEAIDARFQEGAWGTYINGGAATYHSAGGQGEVGIFGMPTSWSTMRGGIIAMEYNGQGAAGGSFDFRLHAPTRFTPFVGLGGVCTFGGFGHGTRFTYNSAGVKVPRNRTVFPVGLAALVPEVGASYWMTSRTRLNVGASWYVIDGHQPDFLLVSASMEFVMRPPQCPVIPTPVAPIEDDDDLPSNYFFSAEEMKQQSANLVGSPVHQTTAVSHDVTDNCESPKESEVEGSLIVPILPRPDIFTVEFPSRDKAAIGNNAMIDSDRMKQPTPDVIPSDHESTDAWLHDATSNPKR